MLGFEFWEYIFDKYPIVAYILGTLAIIGFVALIVYSIIDYIKGKR